MSPELKKLAEEISDTVDTIKADHERRLSDLETKQARSRNPGAGLSQSDEVKEFAEFCRKGIAPSGSKAWETGTPADGGYAVPSEIDSVIAKLLRDLSPVRSVARVVQTNTGNFSQVVSTNAMAGAWTSETAARPETDTPTLAQVAPTIGELYCNPAVTQTALDDMFFNVENWITEEIAQAFAELEGAAFVSGDGSDKPKGFLAYSTAATGDGSRAYGTLQHIATGQAATLPTSDAGVVDLLTDVVYSLKSGYRRNAVWMMNSSLLATIRKLTDSENRNIWTQNLAAGEPSLLLGYPVIEVPDMPAVAANSLPIAFGDFSRGYLIVDRVGIRTLRDPLTHKPYVHFYTTKRVGGAVVDSQAIKLVKVASA